jgi:hypothetical protein
VLEDLRGQVCVDLTPFVKQLIDVAVGEQPPVYSVPSINFLRVLADVSRAVLGERVVPSRMIREAVNFI